MSRPLKVPAGKADDKPGGDRNENGIAADEQGRGEHRRAGGDGTDGKVDAAGDDHHRHADSDAGGNARLLQAVYEIALGEEHVREQTEHGADDEEADQRAQVADGEAYAQPAQKGRRRGVVGGEACIVHAAWLGLSASPTISR